MHNSKENLSDIAKRLRSSMRNIHTGQTLVAVEVAKMADVWDKKYKAEAGGLELGPWLIKEVDPTIRLVTYMDLATAAARAGTLSNRVESGALKWMHHQIPDDKTFKAAFAEVSKEFREQESLPLKLSQVRRVCSRFSVPRRGREGLRDQVRSLKARIVRLEAQVRGLGKEPVE